MSAAIHTATHKYDAPYANVCVVILALTLLAGYATVAAAQTNPDAAQASNICNSDTDIFCIEGDKDKAARLNRQALEYVAKQDYDQALGFLKQAVELDSTNPEYHYHLGLAYYNKGMLEEEESSYMNVLAIEPNDPKLNPVLANTYFALACVYAQQGKKDQAFEQLEKLSTIDPIMLYHNVRDKDLDSLRDDPRYTQLIAKKSDNISASGKTKAPDEAKKSSKPAKSRKTAKPKKPANSKQIN